MKFKRKLACRLPTYTTLAASPGLSPIPDDWADGRLCRREINLEESEIADAQWFSPPHMPQLPPKISIARQLIEAYLNRHAKVLSL